MPTLTEVTDDLRRQTARHARVNAEFRAAIWEWNQKPRPKPPPIPRPRPKPQ